jgi:2,4-dienoyl-CoA reductase-like NADH-dependent reductase (Old Yellow Enzyme family)
MSRLFEPTSINGMAMANRFVRSATYEGMAGDDGSCTQELIDYMARLAKGGVGLIITGDAYVSLDGQALPRQMGAYSEDLLPGLLEMTRAVHGEGGKIAIQLCHAGWQASPKLMGATPIGPSVCSLEGREPCREMTLEDIAGVIASFARASDPAKMAEFDAVQIPCSPRIPAQRVPLTLFQRKKR